MNKDKTRAVMGMYFYNKYMQDMERFKLLADDSLQEARKFCPHDETDISRKYEPGGYDYVSTVIITEKCRLCGTILSNYHDPRHKGDYA